MEPGPDLEPDVDKYHGGIHEGADPLVLAAVVKGLKIKLESWYGRQTEVTSGKAPQERLATSPMAIHIELNQGLREASRVIERLFSLLEKTRTYRMMLIAGNREVIGWKLETKQGLEGSTYTEPSDEEVILPADSVIPITYAATHYALYRPSGMPDEAHYYDAHQLFIGSHEQGVIPLFKLGFLINTGGDLRVEET